MEDPLSHIDTLARNTARNVQFPVVFGRLCACEKLILQGVFTFLNIHERYVQYDLSIYIESQLSRSISLYSDCLLDITGFADSGVHMTHSKSS